MFVYHFKRKNMVGDRLLPMNSQREALPSVYSEHIKKYRGREWLLEKKVPFLDCLWNDVLHFSPINPQIILEVFRREGLVPKVREGEIFETYRIPVEMIPEDNTACYQSFNFDPGNYSVDREKYWRFKKCEYRELLEVPQEQINVWHEDKRAGRTLFWYSHTLHILAQAELDISSCEVICCK